MSFKLNKKLIIFLWLIYISLGMFKLCASVISIQVDQKPDFVRLSLNFPKAVSFDYALKPDGFEVRFFYKAQFLLENLHKIFPGSFYTQKGDETILTIKSSTQYQIYGRSYKNTVFLDIYKPNETEHHKQIIRQVTNPVQPLKEDSFKPKDLKKLSDKIDDYLGKTDVAEVQNTCVLTSRGMLLKYPDTPMAVYELDDKFGIVVLKNIPPVMDEDVQKKYELQWSNFDQGFVIYVPKKNVQDIAITKTKEGWDMDFAAKFSYGNSPRFLMKDKDPEIKISKEGLLDPIQVDGIFVCCTTNPDIFIPIHTINENFEIFPSEMGVAFKLKDPANLSFDDHVITFVADTNSNQLSNYMDDKIIFPSFSKENFIMEKEKLVKTILASDQKDKTAWLNLILFYLANGLFSEAKNELAVLLDKHPETDPEIVKFIYTIIAIFNQHPDQALEGELLKQRKLSLENAAWYAFLKSKTTKDVMPDYLIEYLIANIQKFPDPLKSRLFLILSDQLFIQKNLKFFNQIVSYIDEQQLSHEFILLNQFLKHQFKKLNNLENNPKELQDLFRKSRNPIFMCRIIVEGDLGNVNQPEHEKFIYILESLIPSVKGSDIYYKSLEYIIKYDLLKKKNLKALNNAAILKKANYDAYQHIKPEIIRLLKDMLTADRLKKIGLVNMLTLLNLFVDEVPIDEDFIDFSLKFIRNIEHIGAVQDSIKFLENYKARPDLVLSKDQQENFLLLLVDLYIQDDNREKAADIIEKLQLHQSNFFIDPEMIDVLKAQLELSNNNLDNALNTLKNNHLMSGLKMKLSILWKKENWPAIAEITEDLIERYSDILDEEEKERYIVHMAAALVLNESKYQVNSIGRQKTKITLQNVIKKYKKTLIKYKDLFEELTKEPHHSPDGKLTKKIIFDELNKADRMENLFQQIKTIPAN